MENDPSPPSLYFPHLISKTSPPSHDLTHITSLASPSSRLPSIASSHFTNPSLTLTCFSPLLASPSPLLSLLYHRLSSSFSSLPSSLVSLLLSSPPLSSSPPHSLLPYLSFLFSPLLPLLCLSHLSSSPLLSYPLIVSQRSSPPQLSFLFTSVLLQTSYLRKTTRKKTQ